MAPEPLESAEVQSEKRRSKSAAIAERERIAWERRKRFEEKMQWVDMYEGLEQGQEQRRVYEDVRTKQKVVRL